MIQMDIIGEQKNKPEMNNFGLLERDRQTKFRFSDAIHDYMAQPPWPAHPR